MISVIEQLGEISWTALGSTLATWKPGTRGYLTLHKHGKPKSPEQLGYYYAVILPEAVKAFKDDSTAIEFWTGSIKTKTRKRICIPLSKDGVDWFLKLSYSEYHGEYKDKSEMSKGECAAYEDFCIKWLAEHKGCQIPPADPNWRQEPKLKG